MRKEGKIMVGMLPRLSKIENVGGKKRGRVQNVSMSP
jgi:hypothetical protein